MIRRYDEMILNELMDKYENSLLYTGENKRRQNIAIAITENSLPEYFDLTRPEYYEMIHAQLMEMESKGFLTLVWKNHKVGHILEKCVLCTGKVEEIYSFLHRRPKTEKEGEILQICNEYAGLHPDMDRFLNWVRIRLEEKKSVKMYVNSDKPDEFRSRIKLLDAILNNTEEVFWREFSVRFFKDSKIAEKELSTAAAILARFSEEEGLQELETEQVLEEFGIYKNPSWVMLKGCGRFKIEKTDNLGNENWVILEDFVGGIGLSSEDIACVRWDTAYLPRHVITVENLTSFHRCRQPNTLMIYLGGYHNKAKRQFLKQLYGCCSMANVTFGHFGDIDCGGFLIWKDLREKTGIPFEPVCMDKETYLTYLEFGKPMTNNDLERLKHMVDDPFFTEQRDLFLLMEEKNIKIEQECVKVLRPA